MRQERRKKKDIVVFVNGCFDILHPAHIQILERAKSFGTKLVVGLNSDRSIRKLKGPGRPILDQESRKRMLEALRCVDEVVIFNEKRIRKVVQRVNPDILVQGNDHTEDQIRKIDRLPSSLRIQIVHTHASFPGARRVTTSAIIEKIRRLK